MDRRICLIALGWWCLFQASGARGEESEKAAEAIQVGVGDWPWWRGPTSDGIAAQGEKPPVEWSATKNVRWKARLPGRGHGSPIVVGAYVYIATADEGAGEQAVHCFDRASGAAAWKKVVHAGKLDRKGNKKTSQASSSLACDGKRLFVNFLNDNAIFTTALSMQGETIWQTKVSRFATHQGFASSPALYQSLVIVTSDSPAGGAVAGLRRDTGEVVWREERPKKANYTSPVVLKVAGKDQLLVSGCDIVSSFEPLTGHKIWETGGSTTECVATMVTDGTRVFVSGGYPKQHTQAIVADGSLKTAWENGSQVYVPSMVVDEGYLYAVQDTGVAICWNCATGEMMWRSRLGGTFSSSLVLVAGNLWATNEAGQTFIFKATRTGYEKVAENQLGDEVFSTPAFSRNEVFQRVAEVKDGERAEFLYSLGAK